jgi:hypothetical protein
MIISCTTATNAVVSPVEEKKNDASSGDARRLSLTVENPTRFTIYFDGNQWVEKKSRGTVILYIEDATLSRGFDIRYEIPLSGSVSLYPIGDHRTIRDQASFTVNEPHLIDRYGPYLKITNRANNAISFYTNGTVNPSWEQKGSPLNDYITWTDKREFSRDETVIFDIGRDFNHDAYFIRDTRRNVPLVLPQRTEKNYIYEYEYTPQGIVFTDARPLHRIGEPSWNRLIPDAVSALEITETPEKDRSTLLTALSGNRFIQYTLDQEGGIQNREAWTVGGNEYIDLRTAAASGEPGRFIAAGGADSFEGAFSDPPYTAWIGALGDNASLLWETDLGRFETEDLNRYGPVQSLARDPGGDRYRFCGDLIAWDSPGENPLPESYMGSFRIAEGRGLVEDPPVILEGLSLTHISCGRDGGFYITGKRWANGRAAALVQSRDSGGRLLWEISPPLPGNSWYRCAAVDEDGGRIILAGTLGAPSPAGGGGRPFIQALALGDGAVQWLRILEEDVFSNMNAAAAVAKAAEYGYAITLSPVSGGRETGPFMAARVNEAGRYIHKEADG